MAARSMFYDLLIDQQIDNPRLYILSTHLTDEASELFEEFFILQEGQLLLQKTADEWYQHIVAVKVNATDVVAAIGELAIIHQHMFMQEMVAIVHTKCQA
ncbi:hypothetical protein MHB42_05665 [Lysinibacillus sp. FSL K6-0232]|uniref:hypothetical protein n=1 Tax=unclassified Lysinibacillus TaxID=2636778 RepID=UPI0030FC6EBF